MPWSRVWILKSGSRNWGLALMASALLPACDSRHLVTPPKPCVSLVRGADWFKMSTDTSLLPSTSAQPRPLSASCPARSLPFLSLLQDSDQMGCSKCVLLLDKLFWIIRETTLSVPSPLLMLWTCIVFIYFPELFFLNQNASLSIKFLEEIHFSLRTRLSFMPSLPVPSGSVRDAR